jgi:multiple sugar transport system ATP-binding protein
MGKLIEFKNLCVKYKNNDDLTIKDMNIEIEDGEFIVFVGPSGCGKSTTLKVLSGLEDVHSGEIYISGELANYKEPKDRNIAMVFQNYALYPHFSVRKNIEVGLKNAKLPKSEVRKKTDIVAEKLHITTILDKYPKDLSGGQQQRVALARAIIRDPLVYIFDEPLSNLDAKLRHSTRNEIISMHRELKKTFFYVTHDQVEAMTMADRIVVLKDGVVQQIDTPKNIFYNPYNLFVAQFIGNPEINTISVKVKPDATLVLSDDSSIKLEHSNKDNILKQEEVILCFRPDDVEYSKNAREGFLEVQVKSKEMLGNTTIVNGKLAGHEINFVVRTSDFEGDEEVYYIQIDTKKCLFFDPVSEKNINVN